VNGQENACKKATRNGVAAITFRTHLGLTCALGSFLSHRIYSDPGRQESE
jgi:hypothetical protein